MTVLPDPHPTLRHPIAKGWLVHCVTASGAICGMFGIIAVADNQPRKAILWLVVAMILDGIDGPVARAWSVTEHVPRIDGYALDLIVDFVTCVVIPVIFLHRFGMLPEGMSLVVGAFVLFVGALWMSRTDQMTDDHWFNGFPGEWNMAIPTLYLLDAGPTVVFIVCVVLGLSQLSNWKFVHPMKVRYLRPVTVTATVLWLVAVLAMAAVSPDRHWWGTVLLLVCPAYITVIGAWRTFDEKRWLAAA
jgi:phosphatidylcholine synthase